MEEVEDEGLVPQAEGVDVDKGGAGQEDADEQGRAARGRTVRLAAPAEPRGEEGKDEEDGVAERRRRNRRAQPGEEQDGRTDRRAGRPGAVVPTAPLSPEVTAGSPLTGLASIRIPLADTQSGQETKSLTRFLSICQEVVLGSPQARPAMIVCMSPSTMRMLPSAALAER